jgi:hypothetical protein
MRVVNQWYSDIADLRAEHKLVVFMRDNAGENKSKEIKGFFKFVGVWNHFSTPKEKWQNGPAESTINSIMIIARTVMTESGLGDRFWFKAAAAENDVFNATFKTRIKTSPHQAMYGEPKDDSVFRSFGCKSVVYLNNECRENGRHRAKAVDAMNLGFAHKTSEHVQYMWKGKL